MGVLEDLLGGHNKNPELPVIEEKHSNSKICGFWNHQGIFFGSWPNRKSFIFKDSIKLLLLAGRKIMRGWPATDHEKLAFYFNFYIFTLNLSFAWPVEGQPLLISLQVNNKGFIESLELKLFLFDQDPEVFSWEFQKLHFQYFSSVTGNSVFCIMAT